MPEGQRGTRRQARLSSDLAILTVLGPGSSFGEIALLREEAERSATVTALDAVETFVVGKADFARMRRTTPALDRFLALPRPSTGTKTMIVNYEQMMEIRRRLGQSGIEGKSNT